MTDDRPDKPELTTEQIMLIRQAVREIRDDVRTRVEALIASLDFDLAASDARS